MTQIPESNSITLLFDTHRMQVGCVLLQALAGCSEHNGFVQRYFNSRTWATSPTAHMKLITGTKQQWIKIAERCNMRHSNDNQKSVAAN